jgi:2-keto-3-deoxy-L-rhamnonate aldolase RhmA
MVNTAEQAEAAVLATKYPPLGQRGFGYCRANTYGVDFERYTSAWNEDGLVIVQVEQIEGVNNIEAILKVKGVDVVFVGPGDLSGSMGIPGQLDHPKLIAATDRVARACREHNVAAGLHIVGSDPLRIERALEAGFRMLALSLDAMLLYSAAREFASHARSLAKRFENFD